MARTGLRQRSAIKPPTRFSISPKKTTARKKTGKKATATPSGVAKSTRGRKKGESVKSSATADALRIQAEREAEEARHKKKISARDARAKRRAALPLTSPAEAKQKQKQKKTKPVSAAAKPEAVEKAPSRPQSSTIASSAVSGSKPPPSMAGPGVPLVTPSPKPGLMKRSGSVPPRSSFVGVSADRTSKPRRGT